MTKQFKIGDVVQLKSGGPSMTISEEMDGSVEKYWCIWFKGASREKASFEADILKKYVAPAP